MSSHLPPALILILGALLVPLLRGRLRQGFVLLLPVLGFLNLLGLAQEPAGTLLTLRFLDFDLLVLTVDRLSLVFGYVFHIAVFVTLLYAMADNRLVELMSGLVYAGSALGVLFAGDYLTFFCFWEMMTLSSTLLIWARGTKRSWNAGLRYFIIHAVGGVILLFGILLHAHEQGSVEIGPLVLGSLSSYLIFFGFGVNCAWPMLHSWLSDAYPEATVAGTVFLSAFTTKTAVYALARTFAGTEELIWIGAAMAAFPIFYAVIENDLRRVLSYSMINQVGFMVVGIGIGTELSLNGAAAHAFADILFKGLLFMAMGAVLRQTGKINATDLGGLYKSMPYTTVFCCIGAASISAFPLFSAFATKSLIMTAAAQGGLTVTWLLLLFASAGVFHHAGIKIPFFAFFSHDSGLRPKEAPPCMLVAMGITACLCIGLGVFPGVLYDLLPYPVDYAPYSVSHVLTQLELLVFSALAFTLLTLAGLYPAEMRATNLDADWLYRKGAQAFMWFIHVPMGVVGRGLQRFVFDMVPRSLVWVGRDPIGALKIGSWHALMLVSVPEWKRKLRQRIEADRAYHHGDVLQTWPVGATVLWVSVFLLGYLLFYYLH
jgi:multicomponent Na+:H+ antiporter subunit D